MFSFVGTALFLYKLNFRGLFHPKAGNASVGGTSLEAGSLNFRGGSTLFWDQLLWVEPPRRLDP